MNRGHSAAKDCAASGAARFACGWDERDARKQAPKDRAVFVFVRPSRPMRRPEADAPTRTVCVVSRQLRPVSVAPCLVREEFPAISAISALGLYLEPRFAEHDLVAGLQPHAA